MPKGVYQRTKEHKKHHKAAMNCPKVRAKISDSMKITRLAQEQDKNSETRNRRTKAILKARTKNGSLQKTKSETAMENLLNKIFPNEYSFVGLGDFILAGKCPDFVNINGQQKIIEIIGDNSEWYINHFPSELQERADLFAQYGYNTLFITAKELNDLESLAKKNR